MYAPVADVTVGSSLIMLNYMISALPHFLLYFGTAIALAVAYLAVYVRVTPHAEFGLIRMGNSAAAAQLSGSFLGFAIAMAAVITHSVSIPDMIVWSIVALVVQLAVFFVLTRVVFRGAERGIVENQVSSGVLIGAFSLAAGILQAACMVP